MPEGNDKIASNTDASQVNSWDEVFKKSVVSVSSLTNALLNATEIINVLKSADKNSVASSASAYLTAFIDSFEKEAAKSGRAEVDVGLDSVQEKFKQFLTDSKNMDIKSLVTEKFNYLKQKIENEDKANSNIDVITEGVYGLMASGDSVISGQEYLEIIRSLNLGTESYAIPFVVNGTPPSTSVANKIVFAMLDDLGKMAGKVSAQLTDSLLLRTPLAKMVSTSSLVSGYLACMNTMAAINSLCDMYKDFSLPGVNCNFGVVAISGALTGVYEELQFSFPEMFKDMNALSSNMKRTAGFDERIAESYLKVLKINQENFNSYNKIFAAIDEKKREELLNKLLEEGNISEFQKTALIFLSRYCSGPASVAIKALECYGIIRDLVSEAVFEAPKDIVRVAASSVRTVASIGKGIVSGIAEVVRSGKSKIYG